MPVNSDISHQSVLTKCKFYGGGAYLLGTGSLFGGSGAPTTGGGAQIIGGGAGLRPNLTPDAMDCCIAGSSLIAVTRSSYSVISVPEVCRDCAL